MIDIEILSLQHRKNIYTNIYIYIYVYVQIDKHFRFNIFIYNKNKKQKKQIKTTWQKHHQRNQQRKAHQKAVNADAEEEKVSPSTSTKY